jgi:hypothetical protein
MRAWLTFFAHGVARYSGGTMKLVLAMFLISVHVFASTPAEEARKVVDDYVGLYTATTLPAWKALFHPQMTASHAAADGSIRVRTLDEFFSAQESGFKEDPAMSEKLQHVRLFIGNRIARVTADYVFSSKSRSGRGKLGLHLVQGTKGWKIVGVVFSYDKQ